MIHIDLRCNIVAGESEGTVIKLIETFNSGVTCMYTVEIKQGDFIIEIQYKKTQKQEANNAYNAISKAEFYLDKSGV